MTFRSMTLRIECHYDECRDAECSDLLNVMLSVVRLNVVMLSVVAPKKVVVNMSHHLTAIRAFHSKTFCAK